MHSTDHETGEVTLAQQCQSTEIDMETGESDTNIATIPTVRKRTFVIPKKLIQTPKSQKRKLRCMDNIDNYTLFKKEEVINLQEVSFQIHSWFFWYCIILSLFSKEIILGSNVTSHRLFLLPTMFVCFRLYAALMAFVEIFLHVWAHKKNSRNTDANVYYRSPLHIITSQFCATCLHEKQMDKVSKLQEKRLKNWRQHFKHVARFWSYY